MPDNPPITDQPAARSSRSLGAVIAWALVFPALGAATAYGLTDRFILPRMGLGPDLQRVVAIADHTRTGLGDRPVVVFLGDSLTIEGIDASIVEKSSPARAGNGEGGWHAQNIGLNGINPTGLSVLLPAILDAHPDAVVFMFRPEDLGDPGSIPTDRAYAYAYSGIAGRLPAGDDLKTRTGLDRKTIEALRSSRFGQVVHFRSVPLRSINTIIRLGLRSGMRQSADDDWRSPHNMSMASVGEQKLATHIANTIASVDRRVGADNKNTGIGTARIGTLAAMVREAGVTPILVMAPQHPRLRERYAALGPVLRERLMQIASANDGLFIDASELLDESGFADAIHPNGDGRAALSALIGAGLPTPTTGLPAYEEGSEP